MMKGVLSNLPDPLPKCHHRVISWGEDYWGCCEGCGGSIRRRKPGRPTKLTPEVAQHIVDQVREGAFVHVAAAQVGVADSTLRNWLVRDEPLYRDFQMRVEQAHAQKRGECEVLVAMTDPKYWLKNAAKDDGPDRPGWGDRVEVKGEMDHRHGHVHTTLEQLHMEQLERLSDEELEQLQKLQAKLLPPPGSSDPEDES